MISLIICTYNRDKYIYNVLNSIAENDFDTNLYEIVLVDNNSNDDTMLECNKFSNNFPSVTFRYFFETNQGLSYARNRGIKEALGNVVVFVDDDALVNKDYIKTYYDFFEYNIDIDAAGGPIIPQYETEEPSWISTITKKLLTGYLYLGETQKEFPANNYPGGGNAAYRKNIFDKIGLFNVELGRNGKSLVGSEEKDIFDKMTAKGMKFYYLPKSILFHLIPAYKLTPDYLINLSFSIGQGEQIRTKSISTQKYHKRIFSELLKWAASICLMFLYTISFAPSKGWKLLIFRYNVSRGLMSKF